MPKIYLFTLLSFVLQVGYSQYQIGIIPRVSPDKAVYQKIGYTEIELRYGSPAVNGRQIWGELVPYDEIWRAGANSATTIALNAAISFDEMTLDSGKYTFFLLPKENDKWTAIFSKTPKQWGAFRYKEEDDALRVEVSPRTTSYKNERLNYTINQAGFQYGSINLTWGFMEISIPFETNYLAAFEEEVEARAAAQPDYIKWIPYLQGAAHLEEIKNNKELASIWLDKAEEIMGLSSEWNEQFYPRPYVEGHLYWIKAKVLAWKEDYVAAIAYIDKLKGMEQPIFYTKKNETAEIDSYYEDWKEE